MCLVVHNGNPSIIFSFGYIVICAITTILHGMFSFYEITCTRVNFFNENVSMLFFSNSTMYHEFKIHVDDNFRMELMFVFFIQELCTDFLYKC